MELSPEAETSLYPDLLISLPRRFHLRRDEDLSGMSGTGIVAWGVIFPDDRVAMRWNSSVASTVLYDSISDVEWLHGHEGRTSVVVDD